MKAEKPLFFYKNKPVPDGIKTGKGNNGPERTYFPVRNFRNLEGETPVI
jgi:hypothetical protein